jgi:hypothetical protein
MKELIQAAYNAAQEQYPTGHLKGDQIKTHLTNAMSLIDVESAQLMNGKTVSTGVFKLKAFPLKSLPQLEEPNFTDVSVEVAAPAEADDNRLMFDAETFVSMSPAAALEKFGIETIGQMLSNLKVEVKDGMNDKQKTAALISFLKNKK